MHTRIPSVVAIVVAVLVLTMPLATATRSTDATTAADTAKTRRYKPVTGSASAPQRAKERTIAPFPVPGDSSGRSVTLWRTLNLPRTGITTVAPLPPPGGKLAPGAMPAPGATDTSGMSPRDKLIRQRIEKHVGDCDDEYMDLPEPTYRELPVPPPGAKRPPPKTIVRVFAFIGEDGRLEVAETHGTATPLDSAAVACVQRWRFKPAVHCGHPVPVWVVVPIRFDGP